MQKVIQFLILRINFIIFLFFEILALILYFSNNPYQGAAFFNSSNAISASMMDFSSNTRDYIELQDVNDKLAKENAKLRFLLSSKIVQNDISNRITNDTSTIKKYNYIPAKVINNSTDKYKNYMTINKGSADSIAVGMGVVCFDGIVGKVKSCSKNYATITSVLHQDMLISSKLKRIGAIGALRWDGNNAQMAKLFYIPRHLEVKKGDTIVSSEHNSVFPEGEMVGRVTSINIKGDENFYTINVRLSTDFNKLSYVYVIKNKFKIEQDSLESLNNLGKNESK